MSSLWLPLYDRTCTGHALYSACPVHVRSYNGNLAVNCVFPHCLTPCERPTANVSASDHKVDMHCCMQAAWCERPVNETRHAQQLNVLKQRLRKREAVFFFSRRSFDFLRSSLTVVWIVDQHTKKTTPSYTNVKRYRIDHAVTAVSMPVMRLNFAPDPRQVHTERFSFQDQAAWDLARLLWKWIRHPAYREL